MTWGNFALWNVQIALLAGVAAALVVIFRLRPAPARLAWWQAVLVVCLLLPAIQPWRRQTVVLPAVTAPTAVLTIAAPAQPAPAPPFRWGDAALAALATGILLRAGWFGLGIARLARYRRAAQPLDPMPGPVAEACRLIGVYPEIALSEEVSGPVTFGFRSPVILLPARFFELEPAVQSGIVTHELLHVRRRDWLFTAAEELVRAVFWFHPAIWWMLGQIQLAREQSVDRAVVALSLARERYVDALLALSGVRQQLDLAPAPLFLRRRHLTARVAAILKEVHMPKRKLLGSVAACAGGLLLAGWLVCGRLPLQAAPRFVQDAPGVTVTGADKILHRIAVPYPAEAREKSIEGTVVLDVQVAPDGTVSDASVISGPMELRRSALSSVLNWHFQREAAGRQQVLVEFKAVAAPAPTPAGVPGGVVGGVPGGVGHAPAAEKNAMPLPFDRMLIRGLSQAAEADLRSRLNLQEGQLMDAETMKRVRQIVSNFDQHLRVIEATSLSSKRPGGGGPPEPAPLPKRSLVITPESGITVSPEHAPAPGEQPSGMPLAGVPHRLVRYDIQGLSPEAAEELRRRLPVKEGDMIQSEDFRRIREAVKAFDPHLDSGTVSSSAPRRLGPDGNKVLPELINMTIHIRSARYPEGTELAQYGRVQRPDQNPSANGVQRIRVGMNVQAAKLIRSVPPVYPPLATQARIQGIVHLSIIVSPKGEVTGMTALSGHPLLVPAAMEAVRQREYAPTLLNGVPVEVVSETEVEFRLDR